jgi:hypothetical protein
MSDFQQEESAYCDFDVLCVAGNKETDKLSKCRIRDEGRGRAKTIGGK